jgi:hypothetical protein
MTTFEGAVEDSAATVTINWSECYNVFRAKTVEEMIQAFCTSRDIKQRANTGAYGLRESGMFEVSTPHEWTLDSPKPMIVTDKSIAKNCRPERMESLFQFPATFSGKIQNCRLREQIGGAS